MSLQPYGVNLVIVSGSASTSVSLSTISAEVILSKKPRSGPCGSNQVF